MGSGDENVARSNSGSPQFTDFPSLCAWPESSLTNMNGSGLNLLFYIAIQNRNVVGPGQGFQYFKRMAKGTPGDEFGLTRGPDFFST